MDPRRDLTRSQFAELCAYVEQHPRAAAPRAEAEVDLPL